MKELSSNDLHLPFHRYYIKVGRHPSFHRQRLKAWSNTCKRLHPMWEYRLWTDEDNDRIVHEHYVWFLPTYKSFKKPILKVDSVRYMYMHRYGGVYADLDVECLRPMDSLLDAGQVLVPLMSSEYALIHNIPNAWMASVPGHMFWIFMLLNVMKRAKLKDADTRLPEEITGPVPLYETYYNWVENYGVDGLGVTLLAPGLIFPYAWNTKIEAEREVCWAVSSKHNTTACKELLDVKKLGSYTISYWHHSWALTSKEQHLVNAWSGNREEDD
ncbi:hypothetical protein SmJEL517_g02673 [Synchytrium microbalum]|uniref:Alpha 1,4-glycosyltransferase domain-containing protein n=1 Tax=Synchytrium microbalum TaxID=1806994 RepID=A0A507CAZ7_9FUNG|nr:uncharacterized protein SmJEL517_g02673 [Synchytrium microbalum]TPX34705.1 hypothetical protein SmJEL517_g02673 [Synchytrium microbalum]